MARKSAHAIYRLFLAYKAKKDFVGMDMARKFLQMGYTRARRYANHPSGRKYAPGSRQPLPRSQDAAKAQAAAFFHAKWKQAREDGVYLRMRKRHREAYG